MPKKDPRIDAYIAKSADFAKPILLRIRNLVRAACPDVTETIKWGAPFYEHKGILICTPAFKAHCALIFWKGKLIFKEFSAKDNPRKKFRRITSNADLSGDKTLAGYIKQAVVLNEAGIKTPAAKPKTPKKIAVPDYFMAALKKKKRRWPRSGISAPVANGNTSSGLSKPNARKHAPAASRAPSNGLPRANRATGIINK